MRAHGCAAAATSALDHPWGGLGEAPQWTDPEDAAGLVIPRGPPTQPPVPEAVCWDPDWRTSPRGPVPLPSTHFTAATDLSLGISSLFL